MPNYQMLAPLPQSAGVVGNIAPQQSNGIDSFAGGLLSGAATGQQIAASRAQQQNAAAQLAMQQQMQPGMLKAQALANEQAQLGLDTQKHAAQLAAQQQQELANAAGAKNYTAAVVGVYKNQGRPNLAMKFLEASESLTQATIKTQKELMDMTEQEAQNRFKRLQQGGTVAYTLTTLPEELAIYKYNKTYGPLLQQIDPKAPKVGSDSEEIITYLQGAAASLIEWNQRIQQNPDLAKRVLPKEAQKDFVGKPAEAAPQPAIAKLQNVAEQKQQELQQAVAQFGENSPQAQAAQQQVSQIEDAINKETGQGGLVASGIRGIKNVAKNLTKPSTSKKPSYSQADLEHTAKIHNMTVEQVKAKLGAK